MINEEEKNKAIRLYRNKNLTMSEISNLVNISVPKLSIIFREEINNGNLKPRNEYFFGNKARVKQKFNELKLKEMAVDYYENGLNVNEMMKKWEVHPMQLQRMRNIYGEKYGKKNNPRKRPVIQLSKNGELLNEYDSMGLAEKNTNVCEQNISKCCNGKLKSAGGFVWKFK